MRTHVFTRKQRGEIARRADGACEQCRVRLKVGEGEADHILPIELGGANEVANGQWLCRACHADKTGDDVRRIRKADRQRDRHSGAMPSSQRGFRGWRRFNGDLVWKDRR
jgi:5-methylcytosine-specific restriction endonuclease McrA